MAQEIPAHPLFPATRPAPGAAVHARWMLLVAGLALELVVLMVRFDTQSVDEIEDWWGWWLSNVPVIPQILIAVGTALVMVGSERLKTVARIIIEAVADHRMWWAWMVLHITAFCGLALVSQVVFSDKLSRSAHAGAWALTWGLAAAATLVFWGAALAPLRFWWHLARTEAIALGAGLCVGVAAWGAGLLSQALWKPMGSATFQIVTRVLRLIYPEIVSKPAEQLVGTPDFLVRISPECSGYEGIGLVTVFLAAFFWLFRANLRFPRALLLWPVGVAGIWIFNALRIAVLVAIGTSYSPAVAEGGFHSQAGWIAFSLMAVGLALVGLRLPYFSKRSASSSLLRVNVSVRQVSAYLVPFLVLLSSQMAASSLSSGFDRWYPLKALATAAACVWFLKVYAGFDWSWSWWGLANGLIVFGLWLAMSPDDDGRGIELQAGIDSLSPAAAAGWLACRVLGSVLVIPLVEELAFRGYLMRRLSTPDFAEYPFEKCSWIAVGVSSVAFGLLHGRLLAGIVAGVCYALAACRRGRLSEAVLAHATTNGLVAAHVLINGAWEQWA